MRIYLAASLSSERRDTMYKVLAHLRGRGYEVYGPVEHSIDNAWDYSNKEWGRLVFEADVAAIKSSDIVVAISYGRTATTAGTNWEIGYAYGIGKKVIVVEMDKGVQSLMVSNGSWATLDGIKGLKEYDFNLLLKTITNNEQK